MEEPIGFTSITFSGAASGDVFGDGERKSEVENGKFLRSLAEIGLPDGTVSGSIVIAGVSHDATEYLTEEE